MRLDTRVNLTIITGKRLELEGLTLKEYFDSISSWNSYLVDYNVLEGRALINKNGDDNFTFYCSLSKIQPSSEADLTTFKFAATQPQPSLD